MTLIVEHNEIEFGIGDRIRVTQKIEEGGKARSSIFEGMVLAINGRDQGTTFLVRRMGEAGIGIERIFPLGLPTIEKVEVIKKGLSGVRKAKLYYLRGKSLREIEEIYSRAAAKNKPQAAKAKKKRRAPKKKH